MLQRNNQITALGYLASTNRLSNDTPQVSPNRKGRCPEGHRPGLRVFGSYLPGFAVKVKSMPTPAGSHELTSTYFVPDGIVPV